jgi:acylphosphatase
MLEVSMAATYNLERVERLHGTVYGDVQGVGFRYFLMREAYRLGLRGWVRNRQDGTVEFVAEGSRPDLEQLKQAAESGPRMARVAQVDVDWSAAQGGLDGFDLTG